jgi:hypothetical protein
MLMQVKLVKLSPHQCRPRTPPVAPLPPAGGGGSRSGARQEVQRGGGGHALGEVWGGHALGGGGAGGHALEGGGTEGGHPSFSSRVSVIREGGEGNMCKTDFNTIGVDALTSTLGVPTTLGVSNTTGGKEGGASSSVHNPLTTGGSNTTLGASAGGKEGGASSSVCNPRIHNLGASAGGHNLGASATLGDTIGNTLPPQQSPTKAKAQGSALAERADIDGGGGRGGGAGTCARVC